MKKGIYTASFFILIFILFSSNAEAMARKEYGTPLGTYEGDKGIKIISFSKNWTSQEKLKSVYDELLKNFHGEEITYLSNIYIYPDSPDGVAGNYYEDYEISNEGKYVYKKGRYIEIFNGNQYKDVSQFAWVLSHEYGHHFTLYYLLTKENKHFNQWEQTKYAQIRGLTKYKEVEYYSVNDTGYIHKWDVAEIAAEDYVQLFGSPTAKKSTDYKDVKERVEQNIKDYYYSTDSFNLLPQENLSLPLAADVSGLYLYWLGLAGYTTVEPSLPSKPVLTIKKVGEIMPGYSQYEVSWNPISDGKNYEYTLVSYPVEDNHFPRPVKTVVTGEPMKAYIGSAMSSNKNTNSLILDDQYRGEYYFRLFIKNPKGFMFSTEPIKFKFEDKPKKPLYLMTDVPNNHWARESIQTVVDHNIAKGYDDGSFKPENKVTKAEFMAMLIRSINYKVTKQNNENHWFVKQGYLEAAKKLKLITEADYGTNYSKLKYDDFVTRDEMSAMAGNLLKYLGYTAPANQNINFSDAKDIKHKKELSIALRYSILSGYPDRTFKPSKQVTRAEAAAVIYKLLHLMGG
ncbi:S-layer homology domain-containing protein [Defluviitalea saccharophila]|uniref:S-layer homology domain-containing protein n=1 Tax=Defluviitalea saccharophila TaxID=879970 RepID=A0ABZ2Y7N0_9FIRM